MTIHWEQQSKQFMYGRNRQCVLVTCPICNEERWVTLENAKKTNNNICRNCADKNRSVRQKGFIKKCPVCSKKFRVTECHKDQIYCSKECSSISKRNENTNHIPHIVSKVCEYCNKPFSVGYRSRNQKFCSTKCYGLSVRVRIKKICPTCGKEFETASYVNAIHCGSKCYDVSGKNNPNFIHGNSIGTPSNHPYGGSWEYIRKQVKERDNWTCCWNGCNETESLEAHHITRIQEFNTLEEGNDFSNLVTLCLKHHQHVHRYKIKRNTLSKYAKLPDLKISS
jgi:hypothetical protein